MNILQILWLNICVIGGFCWVVILLRRILETLRDLKEKK